MSDLAYLTVAEAAELLRAKKLSPVEYAKALIDRIEKHDSKLNAFLRFTPEHRAGRCAARGSRDRARRVARSVPRRAVRSEGHRRLRGPADDRALEDPARTTSPRPTPW